MAYGIPGNSFLPPPTPGQMYAPMQVPKAVRRIGEQGFWSTHQYAPAQPLANSEFRLFTAPLGQVAQGFAAPLSIGETNLKEGGRIPAQFAFTVDGVACQIYYADSAPMTYTDLAIARNDCVLQWDFVQTRFDIAPIALIGEGGGVFGSTADTGAVDGVNGSREALNNGGGQLWIYRRYPVLLPSNSTFAIVTSFGSGPGAIAFNGGTTVSNVNIRISLLGRFETAIAVG